MIKLIWRQVSVDIFFVDWERPRARNIITVPTETKGNNNGSAKQLNDPRSEGNVSIWRTYFVANEWNEIQSTRKIHMASQIIITLFFLEVLHKIPVQQVTLRISDDNLNSFLFHYISSPDSWIQTLGIVLAEWKFKSRT